MALSPISLTAQPLPREELTSFLRNPRQIEAFERMQLDGDAIQQAINILIDSVNAILIAPIVTYAASPTLAEDRILSNGTGLSLSLASPNATLRLTDTSVTAGMYGSPSRTVAFTVDAQGRLLAAAEYALVTDNVAEGGTNLYFTTARARASVSGTAGVSYVAATGVISLDTAVAATLTGAQTLSNKTLSGYRTSVRATSATTTLTATDTLLIANAASGAITVNLPTAASASGQVYSVKKIDASANAVTIDPSGAETIDGTATKIISAQYGSLTFQSDGATWWVI